MKKLSKLLIVISLCFLTFTGVTCRNEKFYIETHPKVYGSSTTNQKQIRNLAIFIRFNNSSENVKHPIDDEISVQNAEKIFNSDTFEMSTVNGVISVPSFKKYYEMQSYGALSITTEILPKESGKVVAYENTHPIGYYLKYNEENTIGYKTKDEARVREEELLSNAITYVGKNINTLGIDSSELDVDNNGIIDAISFVVEGQKNLPASIGWNDLLWSHMRSNTGIKPTILNKKVVSYTFLYADDYTEAASLLSLNRGTYGTIMHEFGHSLGFMDLYRFESQTAPIGFYDVMGKVVGSNPQNYLTYQISEYNSNTNWHSKMPVISKSTNGITLFKPEFKDKNEKRAVKVQVNENSKEYFVIEYYDKKNTYDSYTSDASGIIVYRVNENNKSNGNTNGGEKGEKDHLFVFRPNEPSLGACEGELTKATLNMKRPSLGKKLDLNNTSFDNESIYYADGTNSGIIVTVTGETDNSVTFNVTFPEVEGSGTKNDPYIIRDAKTFLYFMEMSTEGKYYRLESDLDFSSISSYPKINFYGVLEGNNKVIRNVKTDYGLFYNIGDYGKSAVVSNLNVENIQATGKGDYLGGFASILSNAVIRNVHMKSGQVKNVASLNSLSSTGGFAGNVYHEVTIENCSSYLSVNSPKNVGGFIGLNQNAIMKNIYTSSSVSGNEYVGTFIGLQSITDTTYSVPQNVYYDMLASKGKKAVGGYSSFHNLKVLDAKSLDKGIIGVSVPTQVEVNANSNVNYQVTTEPSSNINYSVSVSDANIAQYENRKIVGKKSGNAKIYVDLAIGSMKIRLTTNVTVKASSIVTTKPTTKVVAITSVKMNQSSLSVVVGKTSKLTATINPNNTTQSKALLWSSSNKSVAIVDNNGNVKGIKVGTAYITVKTSNGKSATIKVTVNKAKPITSVKLNKKTLKIKLNSSATVKATINPSNTTDSKALTWSSSNKNVAIVDKNGKITAVGAGKATITVKTVNGKKASVKVMVSKVSAKKASIAYIKNQVQTGKTIKPAVQVSLNGKTLKSGKDYTVRYKNNKNAGKATVTVKFRGNYTGTKSKTFLIIPSKVNIKNPSTTKKGITVKYAKVKGAKTYQIAYRMKGTNSWTYVTSTSSSKKINRLSSGAEYEVMVRAGIKSGNKKLYGDWSLVKVVKVK